MKNVNRVLILALCVAMLCMAGCSRKTNYAKYDKDGKNVTIELVDLKGTTETTMEYEAGDEITVSVKDIYGKVHLTIVPYVEPPEPVKDENGEVQEPEPVPEPDPILDTDTPGSVKPFTIAEAGTYTIRTSCSMRTSGFVMINGPEPPEEPAPAEEPAAEEGAPAEGEATADEAPAEEETN